VSRHQQHPGRGSRRPGYSGALCVCWRPPRWVGRPSGSGGDSAVVLVRWASRRETSLRSPPSAVVCRPVLAWSGASVRLSVPGVSRIILVRSLRARCSWGRPADGTRPHRRVGSKWAEREAADTQRGPYCHSRPWSAGLAYLSRSSSSRHLSPSAAACESPGSAATICFEMVNGSFFVGPASRNSRAFSRTACTGSPGPVSMPSYMSMKRTSHFRAASEARSGISHFFSIRYRKYLRHHYRVANCYVNAPHLRRSPRRPRPLGAAP
jgi:hypothetical protein